MMRVLWLGLFTVSLMGCAADRLVDSGSANGDVGGQDDGQSELAADASPDFIEDLPEDVGGEDAEPRDASPSPDAVVVEPDVNPEDVETSMDVPPRCGDGVRDRGEACDDGDDDDNDGCLSNCEEARCGDGVVYEGVEACDDGDNDDNDGCLSNCEEARCGDGVVYEGVEECDEGEGGLLGVCSEDCTLTTCGDNVLDPGETCDDGNTAAGDGCDGECRWEYAFWNENDRQRNIEVSNDGLTIQVTSDSVNDTIRATEGKISGRWYWEVIVLAAGDSNYNGVCIATADSWLEISTGGSNPGASYSRGGQFDGYPRIRRSLQPYGVGQVVSVAIDVDGNGLYFAIDGEWVLGAEPGVDPPALPLGVSGEAAYPCINLSQGDVYRANFGQEPFLVDVPEGYFPGLR